MVSWLIIEPGTSRIRNKDIAHEMATQMSDQESRIIFMFCFIIIVFHVLNSSCDAYRRIQLSLTLNSVAYEEKYIFKIY